MLRDRYPKKRSLRPIEITLQSGPGAARRGLAELMKALGPLGLDIEEAGTVELVMAEALNNVVEHAYPKDTPDGPIRIRCKHSRDGLHLIIIDEGQGMPDGKTPLGETVNLNVDMRDMPEGGFGWFLIRDLAKDVEYLRKGWENHLCLRLAVAVQESG